MTKGESEEKIRHLCGVWAKERGITPSPEIELSFSDFKSWLSSKGYENYLNFRSVMGANHDAERWFIEETKQSWRY